MNRETEHCLVQTSLRAASWHFTKQIIGAKYLTLYRLPALSLLRCECCSLIVNSAGAERSWQLPDYCVVVCVIDSLCCCVVTAQSRRRGAGEYATSDIHSKERHRQRWWAALRLQRSAVVQLPGLRRPAWRHNRRTQAASATNTSSGALNPVVSLTDIDTDEETGAKRSKSKASSRSQPKNKRPNSHQVRIISYVINLMVHIINGTNLQHILIQRYLTSRHLFILFS